MITYTAGGSDLELAAWVAVGVGALMTVIRLLRRETLQFALAGFAGVAISAFIADRTGRPRTSSSRACCSTPPTPPRIWSRSWFADR